MPTSYYLRPDGVSRYLRPDGTSFYLMPEPPVPSGVPLARFGDSDNDLYLKWAMLVQAGNGQSIAVLEVSGAGVSGVNGEYSESGTSDGKTAYQNSGYRIEWVSGDSFWIIKPIGGDGVYSSNGGETNPWDVVSWNGNPPTPTVTQL